MLKIGSGIGREQVRRAVARGEGLTVTYSDVLSAEDIRETVAGVREAGSPRDTRPLLAWLGSHPNTPEEVLRELFEGASREILVSLAMNPNLPGDLKRTLLDHEDDDVRSYANHTFSQTRKH